MTGLAGLRRGRLARLPYAVLMALLLGSYSAFAIAVGVEWGLKNALGVVIPVTVLALGLRLWLSAARWRAIGLPGWIFAAITTAALVLAPAPLGPTAATLLIAGVLLVETLVPDHAKGGRAGSTG